MASNDNKRYYWLRLKKDFFQQHQIKVLKALPNGRLYALIYLELLAESTSHEGELRYSQMLPYDIVTLASVIDEDKDNVEKAIETLINLELVEILDDGTIFMREIQKLIGSETGQTQRKRIAREGGKSYPENTLEIRDKRIENRDKNIYSEKLVEALNDFKEMRKKIKKPLTDKAEKLLINKLNELSTNEDEQIKILEQSTLNCWQSVYPLQDKQNKQIDTMPVYDNSINKKLSNSELDDLLSLRGKQ